MAIFFLDFQILEHIFLKIITLKPELFSVKTEHPKIEMDFTTK